MRIRTNKLSPAYTILEMSVAMTMSAIILVALVMASVALQRSFNAVEAYSISEGDQLRVQDYIAMDCRRSTNAVVANGSWVNSGGTYTWVADASGPQTLILTVPGYYDGSGNVVAPSFTPSGSGFAVRYGTGTTTQISYYASGTSFIRQVGTNPTQCASGATWTNCSKTIATNVNNFQVLDLDMTTTVRCSITFLPRFVINDTSSATTKVYANTFLRNPSARH